MERSHSGLVRRLGKAVWGQPHRGFKSLPLRQSIFIYGYVNINMAQISKKLGDNIKRIRLRRKMSQGDICRAIEMDRSYMSAIESGKKNVTSAVVEKIAHALGVSAKELL